MFLVSGIGHNIDFDTCLRAASRTAHDLDGVEEFEVRNGEHWQ